MKVVINVCFGGFSLSPRGLKRYAELKGRECYFFTTGRGPDGHLELHRHVLTPMDEIRDTLFWSAFDIPNPDDVLGDSSRTARYNELYDKHSIENSGIERHDPDLIRVVEELGGEHRTGASGQCAELRIVEIPDGTEYEISEYDGSEHIAETHRTWR